VGLRVRVLGAGASTFLLLHGLAGSHRYFGASFDTLAAEGRLVVPDLLGFGGSPRPDDGDYGPDAHADAVLAAMVALGVQPPVYVGAHSVGTLVALRLALRHRDWIRGLVAFGPPLYRTSEHARVHLSRLGFLVRLFAMETPWARAVCGWMCRHREAAARIAEWMRPDLPPEIARDGVQHSWLSYSGSLRNLVLGQDATRDLERIRVPVHLVAGDGDSVVELEFLRELVTMHPQVRLEMWPGGHDLPLRDPERCVAALRSLAAGPQNPARTPTTARS
jgi:pimeloyl-ACP methyl ester carboxylesterase